MSSVSFQSVSAANSTSTVTTYTVQSDLEKLIQDLKNGVSPTADYQTFTSDAATLIQSGGGTPAFSLAIQNMTINGNDLSNFIAHGGSVDAAIGQATALLNQLSGTSSLSTVNTDLENLQADLQNGANPEADFTKLLQDGHALIDEGNAPVSFQQAFDSMIASGNALSSFISHGGSVDAAIGQVQAFMDQLSGSNSLSRVNQDLENLQADLQNGVNPQADYQKLLQDGYALINEGDAPASFQNSFSNMIENGNDLSNFISHGGSVNMAIGQVQAFMDQLSGSNSLSRVNQDLENLQADLQNGAYSQGDYQKLLNDGYALQDEGSNKTAFLQAFNTMTTTGDNLSKFVQSGAGTAADALKDVQNFMSLLA